jgi:LysM repeat protein
MRQVRSQWLGAMGAALAVLVGACSDDDDTSAEATLPAIVTTTTTATTVAPTTTQPRFYEVQEGDTLSEIAAAYGLPVQAIMDANLIVDPNRIEVGQILELPLASEIVSTSLPPVTTAPGPVASPPFPTTAP